MYKIMAMYDFKSTTRCCLCYRLPPACILPGMVHVYVGQKVTPLTSSLRLSCTIFYM